ncbi:hypothetical protein OQA88_7015 [Cercophora sp. LCS_1]
MTGKSKNISPSKGVVVSSRPGQRPKGHGIFSSIGQSLSRTSLHRSRNISDGSSGHTTPTKSRPSKLSLSRFSRRPTEQSLEPTIEKHQEEERESPVPMPRPIPIVQDPRQIAEAMPPEYWTGRFMSLHDRLHTEVFEPQNMNTIIEAQAARALFSGNEGEAVVMNNPSTSVYAATRLPRSGNYNRSSLGGRLGGRGGSARRPNGLQYSATSNNVLATMSRMPTSRYPSGPRPKPPSRLGYTEKPTVEPPMLAPGPEDIIDGLNPEELEYDRCSSCEIVRGVKQPFKDKYLNEKRLMYIKDLWEIKKERFLAQQKEERQLRERKEEQERKWKEDQQRQREEYKRLEARRNLMIATATELVNDESRYRRVLVQLESLCVTDEALCSFHS